VTVPASPWTPRAVAPNAGATAGTGHALGALAALRPLHWIVITLSVMLTSGVWWMSHGLVEDRAAMRFENETDDLVHHVTERMSRYADTLQAGVAMISSRGGDIDRNTWRTFAESLDIEHRYPGINGIGVIRYVEPAALADLIARERIDEPDFDVHPPLDGPEHFPIVYIEPLAGNRRALGLDIAHEPRRLIGARAAVASGEPRMTAPITLVQDEAQQSGFLFYAPFQSNAAGGGGTPRVDGLVYAPFIVRSLAAGMLDRENRRLQVTIRDAGEIIHDERDAADSFHDPDPLFTRTVDVPLYGRVWQLEFRSNLVFRHGVVSHLPVLILIAAVIIDLMLIAVFLGMARARERVAGMNTELESRAAALAETNLDLERFACVVSHDLKTPLRGIRDLACYLEEDLEPVLARDDAPPDVAHNIVRLHTQVRRMNGLIEGILDYSAAGTDCLSTETIDCRAVFEEIRETLALDRERLLLAGTIPTIESCRVPFEQVMSNLIGNAIKHHPDPANAIVRVSAESVGVHHRFAIADDGAGIDPRCRERVFEMFQTLEPKDRVESTGVGLSIVRKSVERVGGRVSVVETPGGGATFLVDWPHDVQAGPVRRRATSSAPDGAHYQRAA